MTSASGARSSILRPHLRGKSPDNPRNKHASVLPSPRSIAERSAASADLLGGRNPLLRISIGVAVPADLRNLTRFSTLLAIVLSEGLRQWERQSVKDPCPIEISTPLFGIAPP